MNNDTPKSTAADNPFPTSQDSEKADRTNTSRPEALDKLEQGAHQTINQLADTAAAQVRYAQEVFAKASESVQQKAREWKGTGEEWTECLRDTVKEKPVAALATALAAGFILARLCQRSGQE